MGKSAQDVMAELDAKLREANGMAGDLKRLIAEAKGVIEKDFRARMEAEWEKVQGEINRQIANFTDETGEFTNLMKDKMEKRLAWIAAMCGADEFSATAVAISLIRDAGGTVNVGRSKRVHLVVEEEEDDGPAFAFPVGLNKRLQADDPKLKSAMLRAVSEHRPDIGNFRFGDERRP